MKWRGTDWSEAETDAVTRHLYLRLEHTWYINKKGVIERWEPTHSKIANLWKALGSLTHLEEATEAPSRCPFEFDPDAGQPAGWLTFLGELCGEDMESVERMT